MGEGVAGHRREGYRRLEVGGDLAQTEAASVLLRPCEELVADANSGWLWT